MIEKKNKNKKYKKGGGPPSSPTQIISRTPSSTRHKSINTTPKIKTPFTGQSHFLSKSVQAENAENVANVARTLFFGNNSEINQKPLEEIPPNFVEYPNRTEVPSNYFTNPKKYEKIREELRKKQESIPKSFVLPLRQELNLFNFLSEHIDRLFLETNSNNFLNEVLNILKKSNQGFSEFNNLRLINLFTEQFIFVKKNKNGDLLIEPLIFSLMEMNVFNDYSDLFTNVENNLMETENEILENLMKNNKNSQINKINTSELNYLKNMIHQKKYKHKGQEKKFNIQKQKFILKMLLKRYDLELNPFFVKNDNIFKVLHNFFDLKKQKGGSLTLNEKNQIETVRQTINSVHNFMGTNDTINQSIIFNMKKKKNLINTSGRSKVRKSNSTSCNPSRSYLIDYDNEEEKKLTLTSIESVNVKKCEKNSLFNSCYSNIEEKYLIYLIKKSKVGNNVYYFTFEEWDDANKTLYFKQLLYNVLGRFQFVVNDASNLSQIISFIYDKNHNSKDNLLNYFKIYFLVKMGVLKDKKVFIDEILLASAQKKKKTSTLEQKKNFVKTYKDLVSSQEKNIIDYQKEKIEEIINYIKQKKREVEEYKSLLNQKTFKKSNYESFKELLNDIISKKKELDTILQVKIKLIQLQKFKKNLFSFNIAEPNKKKKINKSSNIGKIKNILDKSLVSIGMKLDPGSADNTYEIELFSDNLYYKLLEDVFHDLKLEECEISFEFIKKNIPSVKPYTMENISVKKLEILKFIFTKNGKTQIVEFNVEKDFNTKEWIRIIMKIILDVYKTEITHNLRINYVSKSKKLPINTNNILTSSESKLTNENINNNVLIKKATNFYELLHRNKFDNHKKNILKSYYKLVRILFSFGYKFKDVVRFILRLKILGDKIQGLEAKYICSLEKDFGATESEIYIKRRILATQDRPLLAFAMVENNINFISKATLNDKKVIFWNFGDAFSLLSNENYAKIGTNNIAYNFLPIMPFFSFNSKLKFRNINKLINEAELNSHHNRNVLLITKILNEMNAILLDYDNFLKEINENEGEKIELPEFNGEYELTGEEKIELPEVNEDYELLREEKIELPEE